MRVAALQHRLHLAFGQDAVAKRHGEPHGLDDLQQFRETDAQGGQVVARGRRALDGQHRAGQHDRGDLLGAGVDGVTLQHGGLAQVPLELAKVQLVFPALRVQLRQFERRGGAGIPQAGPQPQEMARGARGVPRARESRGPPTTRRSVLAPGIAHRDANQPTAVAQRPDHAAVLIGIRTRSKK